MYCFKPKSDPRRCGHLARRGPRLKLKQKGETRAENRIFYSCVRVRVRKERKRRAKGFFLRSTGFLRSKFVRTKTEVHRINKGYVLVPKNTGFCRGSKRGVSGNQRFRI